MIKKIESQQLKLIEKHLIKRSVAYKNVISTSIQVVCRKNDSNKKYVSNLAM